MKFSGTLVFVIGLLLATIAVPSVAAQRSIRVDRPATLTEYDLPGDCQLLNWTANISYGGGFGPLGPFPYPFTMFNPGSLPVALQPGTDTSGFSVAGCAPGAGSDFSTNASDLASVFQINQSGGAIVTNESYVADLNAHGQSPTMCTVNAVSHPCYLATNGQLYQFTDDSIGVVTGAVVWTLFNGDVEIELDEWCSALEPAPAAPPSFTWFGVNYSAGCSNATNDLLFNSTGTLIGYVNDSGNPNTYALHAVSGGTPPTGWMAVTLAIPVLSSSTTLPYAETGTDGSGTLTWTPVAGATGYDVYISQLPGAERVAPWISNTNATTYDFSGNPFETVYYYTVAARTNGLSSPMSNEEASITGNNGYLFGPFQNATYDFNFNPTDDTYSFESDLATLTFSSGGFSGIDMTNTGSAVNTNADSGSFVVAPSGTLSLYPANGSLVNGALSVDGNTLLEANIFNLPSFSVGLRSNSLTALNNRIGIVALWPNTTGYNNTAFGAYAMASNTSGYFNNAAGFFALYGNVSGYNNNAQGSYALSSNLIGYGNSAMGANALENLNTGLRNVAVGNNSGSYITSGEYNVDIGWGAGDPGGDESVDIGDAMYTQQAYVAGIATAQVTGAALMVESDGMLGVLSSSERFKTDIGSLLVDTDRLQHLRPVTFHLKSDRSETLQYGLIAEEVDKIYPQLVLRDKQGQVRGVRYEELTPLLLGQIQRQQQWLAGRGVELADEKAQLAAQGADIRELRRRVAGMRQRERVSQSATMGRRDGQ